MINIAKLLKNCPKGTKLYSPLFGEVELIGVNNDSTKIRVIYNQCFPKDFLSDGRYLDFPEAECLLFPSNDCRTWEGWKLPVDPKFPKFKVGDWIVYDTDSFTLLIKSVRDVNYYFHQGASLPIKHIDEHYHLWTIQDAKDGDVLVSDLGNPFIYNGKIEFSFLGAYIGISRNGEIRLDIFPSTSWTSMNNVSPATKEQRELLFTKIKEIGYEWDTDKKELKKIQPHYDINNFKPKQWVLVRDDDEWEWALTRFSHLSNGSASLFVCINGASFQQCIPFEGNEHLLGTTDMSSEEYINW